MMQDEKSLFVKKIFSEIAPHIDFFTNTFSFGFSKIWRRKLISLSGIKNGDMVLDVCTGTGDLALLIAKKAGPNGCVIGVDFCKEMLDVAKKKIAKRNNTKQSKIHLVLADAKDLVFPENTFDTVTASFGIRNIPDAAAALKEIRMVLKPGGKFLCLELTKPQAKGLLPLYKFYTFKLMPFIAKVVSKTVSPYTYLPQSIEAFYAREDFRKLLNDCGFANAVACPMTFGIATLFIAEKKRL
jgi:demethylmenaquinone methyltransferase/2-methoxy-6-polyprenyl-1,4-benzoquinol methylase